jgi:hypothetical protein
LAAERQTRGEGGCAAVSGPVASHGTVGNDGADVSAWAQQQYDDPKAGKRMVS